MYFKEEVKVGPKKILIVVLLQLNMQEMDQIEEKNQEATCLISLSLQRSIHLLIG